jgi:glutathione S-transferase
MTLTLHYHPLASFCHKVQIALYENGTPFTPVIVDLGDERSRTQLEAIWPVAKMPVLVDEARERVVPETSIIIEYLDQNYFRDVPMLSLDPDIALDIRLWDRFFDLYVQEPMQTIVADRMRAPEDKNLIDLAQAKTRLATSYRMIDDRMATRRWAGGEAFSMVDCAAAPALFYAGIVAPFPEAFRHLEAYFERLLARPSVKRTIDEARPFFDLFPFRDEMPERFRREKAA